MLIHPEVADALARQAPVVALESTIISHGLPRPDNLRIAREIDDAGLVRDTDQGSWHKAESPVSSLSTPGGPGAERERPHNAAFFFASATVAGAGSMTRRHAGVLASRNKNDAHHRQGQVVQQRQELRMH